MNEITEEAMATEEDDRQEATENEEAIAMQNEDIIIYNEIEV